MTIIDKNIQEICTPVRPGHVIVPELITFEKLTETCKKLNAKTTVVKNRNTQTELTNMFRKNEENCWAHGGKKLIYGENMKN